MKKLLIILLVCGIFFSGLPVVFAATPAPTGFGLPQGNPITTRTIESVIRVIYNFIIFFASFAAVATIIISGIMWLVAGDNPERVKRAKGFFWAGIIGSLIILGAGVIINTVGYFVSTIGDPSAGTGSGGTRRTGESCTSNSQCASGNCTEDRSFSPPRRVCG